LSNSYTFGNWKLNADTTVYYILYAGTQQSGGLMSILLVFLCSPLVRRAGPLRWDGRGGSPGVHVRGPARPSAAAPGPSPEPRTPAARQPALRGPCPPSQRHAHQHGLRCQRRFKEG